MQKPPKPTASRQDLQTVAAILVVFLLTVICYWPSLSGPFLFDDIPNLELLGDRGGLDTFDAYLEFVASAQAGPLGRPVSLASFALNGQTWPTDAGPFRVTNLIIHLINGLLLFALSRQLLGNFHTREVATRLALLCMALWLVHPLLVSTTAYIVQRMTQLASLFVLTGLLCYLRGRSLLPERRGWAWIIAGMGISGTLAVLSKESGVLLPLYALIIELTVYGSTRAPQRHALIAVFCLPLAALVGTLAFGWPQLQLGFEFRSFSMSERLMTQLVVLVDYLHQAFAPHLSGLGIIQDDYPISSGLLEPPATLWSLLLILASLVAAIWSRRRRPLLSFGILWFFAGHALEAGPVPLELYFDHRNYLPLFGVLLAACSLLPAVPAQMRRVVPVIVVLFFCLELFLTWQSARLWSDEDLMMRSALVDHPNSLRAQQYVADSQVRRHAYRDALATRRRIAQQFPAHTATRLSILNLECIVGELSPEDVTATLEHVRRGAYDTQIIGFLGPLVANAADKICPAFAMSELQALLDGLLQNPVLRKSTEVRGAAHYFKGIAFEREGRLDDALEQLDQSFDADPQIDTRLQQIVWALQRGRVEDAARYLDLSMEYRDARFWRRSLREEDFETLRQQIERMRHRRPSAPMP